MRNKGPKETNSEGFSAHPELSRRSAAHARRHPASSGRLCEVLDRILAVVQERPERGATPWAGADRGAAGLGLAQRSKRRDHHVVGVERVAADAPEGGGVKSA